MPRDPTETDRLLPTAVSSDPADPTSGRTQLLNRERRRRSQSSVLAVALLSLAIFLLTWGVIFEGFQSPFGRSVPAEQLPEDPLERAKALLDEHPLIDGHIDIPVQARYRYSNHVDKIHLENRDFPLQVNIPKLREGKLGGFFWSAYVPCASDVHYDEGPNYSKATWRVRDTLEQIDVVKLLIQKYRDTFQLATSASGIQGAFSTGKVASLIGLEGAHQLGNSLATLRQYYDLGVRYVTLSHTCNNAFAGSSGIDGKNVEKQGLSDFGVRLVKEMNRLGMIVDASHTSDSTVWDVLKHSEAPFIFSHSNARSVYNSVRNIPDSLLRAIAEIPSDKRPLIMATFAPQFVGQNASLSLVADHIQYIAGIVGHNHIGIGSDFDGILSVPAGLEDASKYPYLIAELIKRGWTDEAVIGLAGGNLIRTFQTIENVANDKDDLPPDTYIYGKRADL